MTGTSIDNTPIQVSDAFPEPNATNVPINQKVSLNLSEMPDVSTIDSNTFYITDANGKKIEGSIAINGGLSSNYSWTFTTGATLDLTPPTLLTANLVNNQINIPINGSISITLSESIDPASLNTGSFYLTNNATSTSVLCTVSLIGNTAILTPTSNLSPNQSYTVTLTNGVKDVSGNPLASNYTLNFTTGASLDTTPPIVSKYKHCV